MAQKLRIIPLAAGEIGKNMTVYEYGRNMIVVGLRGNVPRERHVRHRLVLPDYNYVIQNQDRLRASC